MTTINPPKFLLLNGQVCFRLQAVCSLSLLWLDCAKSVCRNPSEKVTRIHHDKSTSNLVHHADSCNPSNLSSPATHAMTAFIHGSTYKPSKFWLNIALWVARRSCPFTIIEDPELIKLFQSLNNQVLIPSWWTVAHDVREIFKTSQGSVAMMLQVCTYPCAVLFVERAIRAILENFISALTAGHHQMSFPSLV